MSNVNSKVVKKKNDQVDDNNVDINNNKQKTFIVCEEDGGWTIEKEEHIGEHVKELLMDVSEESIRIFEITGEYAPKQSIALLRKLNES